MNLEDLYTAETHEKGSEVNIINPINGKPTDIYITVQGVDSKSFRAAKREAMRSALENDGKDYDSDVATAEILASITIAWRGIESKGKPLDFSKDKAIELYTQAPSVRDQVDGFISDRANFTKG